MSILLYCVAGFDAPAGVPAGVAQLPVLSEQHGGITVFYSSSADPGVWTRDPIRQSAVRFHGVIESLFSRGAVIPFRFPTVLEDENAAVENLKRNLQDYAEFLQKYNNDVQIEVTFTAAPDRGNPARSGTEYLRQRQQRTHRLQKAVEKMEKFAGSARHSWKVRNLNSGVRGYALVSRKSAAELLDSLRHFPGEDGLTFRVTGPWPVTEFLNKGH